MKSFAGEQLHADEQDFRLRAGRSAHVTKYIKGSADVGMCHFPRELNFASESLYFMGTLGALESRGLDRHSLVQFLIFGFIHLTHAAAGDESNDLEASCEYLTGRKHRVGWRVSRWRALWRGKIPRWRADVRDRQIVTVGGVRWLGFGIVRHRYFVQKKAYYATRRLLWAGPSVERALRSTGFV